ncbi:hypothetical protein K2D_27570 [Enterococcus hirae]|nr:hypothetical protein K2D_27570 [Enterococcus hirae]
MIEHCLLVIRVNVRFISKALVLYVYLQLSIHYSLVLLAIKSYSI